MRTVRPVALPRGRRSQPWMLLPSVFALLLWLAVLSGCGSATSGTVAATGASDAPTTTSPATVTTAPTIATTSVPTTEPTAASVVATTTASPSAAAAPVVASGATATDTASAAPTAVTTVVASPHAGAPLQVVAAENFWGSIALQLGGDRVHVTSVITNPDTDPHDYEPKPTDARLVATARQVYAALTSDVFSRLETLLADQRRSPWTVLRGVLAQVDQATVQSLVATVRAVDRLTGLATTS